MVHRQVSVTSPGMLPYDLHQLAVHEDFSSPDYNKWQVPDGQVETLCSPQGLPNETTSALFNQGYPIGSPYNVDLHSTPVNMHYPNIVESPFANVSTNEHDAPFEAGSPYTRHNSISRMTPLSQGSVSVSGTRAGSGRSTTKSSSPGVFPPRSNGRITKSRPRKSQRTSKAVVGKYKKLEMPLSQWAAEKGVEPKDVLAMIERPLEQRRQEARDKKEGKPGRPMNQFMLYRSAFIPVAQRYCEDGEGKNHQVVSRLCGESWQSEPDDFKKIYEGLAKKEREQHARAFPDYKFTPKNKDRMDDEDEDLLNDDEWKPRSRPVQAFQGSARVDSTFAQHPYGSAFPVHEGQFDFDQGFDMSGGFGLGAVHPTFESRPMLNSGDMFDPYYPYPNGSEVMEMQRPDDLPYGQLASLPSQDFGSRFPQEPQMSAFNSLGHYDLSDRGMGQEQQQGSEQQLDPSLLLRHGEKSGGARLVESTPLCDD